MWARAEKEILIVDDDPSVRDLLAYLLRPAGYAIRKANDVTSGLACVAEHRPDLALIDWLPDGSGLELTRTLKVGSEPRRIAVIMISARSLEADQVAALDAGADDYVTKPFSTRELLARIESLLRRFAPPEHAYGEQQELHGLTLDPIAYRAMSNGREVALSPSDCRMLSFLMTHAERVYSRDQLLESVWGHECRVGPRTVDVQVRRLRIALTQLRLAHLVQTVHGVGYRFSIKCR